MKNINKKRVEFQFKGIEVLDSVLKTPKEEVPKGIAYQFDMSLEHRVDLDKKLIMVLTEVHCSINKDMGALSKFKSSCIYFLPQIEDYLDKESNKVSLPDDFITSINSISISTTRGLMFSFLKGTFLHNAVIPIVDPTAFRMEVK